MVNSHKVIKPLATLLVIIGLFSLTNPISDSMLTDAHKEQIVKAHTEAVLAKKLAAVDLKQVSCLAKNIFWESKGEPFHGQVAVARVVINRVTHGFGKNPCNVVYQSAYVNVVNENGEEEKIKVCQFSWVCEGKGEPPLNIKAYSAAYQTAKKIAYDVIAHNAHSDKIPNNVLFFHATYVNPKWPYYKVATIGNHVFYSKSKPKGKKNET